MADKPIIFSAPMVRALLDGRKSQTRRVLKPQPPEGATCYWAHLPGYECWMYQGKPEKMPGNSAYIPSGQLNVSYATGDRLYVREHWRGHIAYDDLAPSAMGGEEPILYLADSAAETWGWGKANPATWGRFRQGMHMPRWASRITLEVTGVRVERLQDISEADAEAEGVRNSLHLQGGRFARDNFAHLWWTINGDGSWEANPFVWCVSFRKLAT